MQPTRACRLTILAALLAVAPLLPAVAGDPAAVITRAPPPKHAASIQMIGATYGLRRTTLICPALPTAIRLCQGKAECAIPAADSVCQPGDKVPSVLIATLSVQYRCFPGDVDRTMSGERPFVLHISCLWVTH